MLQTPALAQPVPSIAPIQRSRPAVVLILLMAAPPARSFFRTQDMGVGDVGYSRDFVQPGAGNTSWTANPPRTPGIDAMAKSPHSIVFHRFYAGSGVWYVAADEISAGCDAHKGSRLHWVTLALPPGPPSPQLADAIGCPHWAHAVSRRGRAVSLGACCAAPLLTLHAAGPSPHAPPDRDRECIFGADGCGTKPAAKCVEGMPLPPTTWTIAEAAKEAGYRTLHVGKVGPAAGSKGNARHFHNLSRIPVTWMPSCTCSGTWATSFPKKATPKARTPITR